VPYRLCPAAYGAVCSTIWLLAWLLASLPVVKATCRLVVPLPPAR